MAVVDYFLKIDGISGESLDDAHKGEIEIDSFSWGVTNASVAVGGGGAVSGRAQFSDLKFTTRVNKSSPTLFSRCATGQHIKEAVITCRKAGERPVEFLKITLSDVLVSAYQSAGTQTAPITVPVDAIVAPVDTIGIVAPDFPEDSVSLRYASLKLAEGPQQHISVVPGATGVLSYDAKTNSYVVGDTANGVLTVGSTGGVVTRGVAEYDVSSLIGLLTSPFSTATLRLMVNEVREAAITPGATIASDDSVSHTRPGNHKPGKLFDVILYTPADLQLTTDDLTRHGTRVGTITVDPSADPASLTIDLTPLERRRQLSTFGIRLQPHGVGIPSLGDTGNEGGDPDYPPDTSRFDTGGSDDDGGTPRASLQASFTLGLVFDSA